MREYGKVISAESGRVEIETEVQSTCNSCKQQSTCPSGMLAKVGNGKKKISSFNLKNQFSVGDNVTLTSHDEGIVVASLLVYFLPIFTALMAALMGQFLIIEMMKLPEYALIIFTFLAGYLAYRGAILWSKKLENKPIFDINIASSNQAESK